MGFPTGVFRIFAGLVADMVDPENFQYLWNPQRVPLALQEARG